MASRVPEHERLATVLARLSDSELAARVEEGQPLTVGIGGTTVRLDVEGIPVFVKRLPLTDLERRPEYRRSTANVFGLPASCHNGLGIVGSPGFSAWRELAATVETTRWVLDGRCPSFPLLHHWRVLPGVPPRPDEHADVDAAVAAWGGLSQVRARIEAVACASAELLLFLEFIPANLADWLADVLTRPDEKEVVAACAMVERELRTVLPFMAANGFVHFDTHFRNILTDGVGLFLADLGLAASVDFELDDDEHAFVLAHATCDVNVLALLVYSVVAARTEPTDPQGRFALIRRWADGEVPVGIPAPVAAVVGRYVALAVIMNDFAERAMQDPMGASYPFVEVGAAYRAAVGA